LKVVEPTGCIVGSALYNTFSTTDIFRAATVKKTVLPVDFFHNSENRECNWFSEFFSFAGTIRTI
jgi:hypothetical protein